ncbi:MAG: endonuclease domain-containing protein [bacterium]|nr:endonuclease domain-containing protein [bacterium]
MTPAEKLLLNKLRKRKINGLRFLRQYSIHKYVIDFYCPEIKLAVEVDGDILYLPDNVEYDMTRQTEIEFYGIRFIRFTNQDDIENINEVVLKLEQLSFPNSI